MLSPLRYLAQLTFSMSRTELSALPDDPCRTYNPHRAPLPADPQADKKGNGFA